MKTMRTWVGVLATLVLAAAYEVGAAESGVLDTMREITTRSSEPEDLRSERLGDALYAHDRIYLIGGGSPDTDLKFQISFKARVAYRWFLGYTQTNHWDIARASAPFRDTTHRPSLFWYDRDRWKPASGPVHVAAGYEHESNGRDGPSSRSLDKLFIKPTFILGAEDKPHGRIAPKVFGYLTRGSQNRDIADYRGYTDLTLAWRDPEGFEVAFLGRLGKTGRYGSAEGGVSYPLADLLRQKAESGRKALPGYLYLQVFYGYGETLLDYNVKVRPQIRVGYLFERGR